MRQQIPCLHGVLETNDGKILAQKKNYKQKNDTQSSKRFSYQLETIDSREEKTTIRVVMQVEVTPAIELNGWAQSSHRHKKAKKTKSHDFSDSAHHLSGQQTGRLTTHRAIDFIQRPCPAWKSIVPNLINGLFWHRIHNHYIAKKGERKRACFQFLGQPLKWISLCLRDRASNGISKISQSTTRISHRNQIISQAISLTRLPSFFL